MEVHDIVEEAVIKPSPRKKKAKWLSEEDLQIAVKRSEKTKEKRKKIYPSEYRVLKNSKER